MPSADFLQQPPATVQELIRLAHQHKDEAELDLMYRILDVAFSNLLFDISMERREVEGLDAPPRLASTYGVHKEAEAARATHALLYGCDGFL
jgi:hypothetical protein